MFRNFLKTTFRNFLKNRSYVIINIVGLGLTLACCIVGYINYRYVVDFDTNHVNYKRIYKIQSNKLVEGSNIPFGITPLPLGYQIQDELAGISHTSRYISLGLVLQKDQKILSKRIGFADPDFFEIFSYPFKYGSQEAFAQSGKIILSSETAEIYFPNTDPIGELIKVVKDNGEIESFIVGGVLEKVPQNTSITFHAFLPFEKYLEYTERENSTWKSFVAATFIMTDEEKYPAHVPKILNEKFVEIQNKARDDWKIASFYLEPLEGLGVKAEDLRANWLNQAPPKPAFVVPFLMAGLMLLIACFNFTNTSLAISSKRLKEIGIRKVMGGNKWQLILQFMGENLVLCTLAMLFAILVSMYLVPAYSAMWDFLDLQLSLFNNPEIYIFLGLLLVFTSVLAGGYPALYVSSYEPVSILKGSTKLSGSNLFSKILLTVQFSFTVLALISSIAFAGNARYQEGLDVGFEKNGILAVQVDNENEYTKYYNEVKSLSSVEKVAGTEEHIGRWSYSRVLRSGEKEMEADMMDFGLDYFDLMDIQLADGRLFEEDLFEHDSKNSIIVNEQLIREFGWEEPIGQILQINDSTRLTVVGVVEDFYLYGFWEPVEPLGIRPAQDERMNFVVAKTSGNLKELQSSLEEAWYKVIPNKPFSADLQDEFMAETQLINKNIIIMFTFLGGLAMILSSIGLFTLVSLNVLKRVKEIGVRKVLGAKVATIVLLLNKPFVMILLIAAIAGSALSYFAIDALMSSIFYYYQAITFVSVAVPLILFFVIALCTSSGRVLTTARKNPVDSLRYE